MTRNECLDLGYHIARIRTIFERHAETLEDDNLVSKLHQFTQALYEFLEKQEFGIHNGPHRQ